MKFDEDLYVQIHTIVRETARKKGFDPQLTEDITQEAAIRVLNALNDPGKEEKIRKLTAYINGIVIRTFYDHFRKLGRNKFDVKDVDWLNDNNIANPYDIILRNQARDFPGIIDDYVNKNPKSFTRQNHRLWEIFKHQEYSVEEIMTRMDMTSAAAVHTAKMRLMERIIAIYKKISLSDHD